MRFIETPLPGAFVIELDRREDERGFFARTWCHDEFARRGLEAQITQCNVSFNQRRGTIRGLHYQAAPHEEAKLVRCTRGALFDVIVDLRPTSPTFGRWTAAELTAENRRALYIPKQFAHGFQTLEDDTEVVYQMSADYHPDSVRGIRWDDPAIGIDWPLRDAVLSPRDRELPRLGEHRVTPQAR